jgi:hypothetical protein
MTPEEMQATDEAITKAYTIGQIDALAAALNDESYMDGLKTMQMVLASDPREERDELMWRVMCGHLARNLMIAALWQTHNEEV